MILTGTKQERVRTAIEFAKAHRTKEYDHNYYAEVYCKAGVPYTQAAENFCREWCGVLSDLAFCYQSGERIDFDFDLMADIPFDNEPPEKRLNFEYEPSSESDEDDYGYPDFAAEIRKRYGADTVPAAEGGYYYPSTIFVKPDGKIAAFLPDNGLEEIEEYDTLFDFLCFQLSGCRLECVEMILERKRLESVGMVLDGKRVDEGMELDRIHAVLEFAKAHGGFENIRLFEEWKSRVSPPIDLTSLTDWKPHTDSEIIELLIKALDGRVPGKIEYVAE